MSRIAPSRLSKSERSIARASHESTWTLKSPNKMGFKTFLARLLVLLPLVAAGIPPALIAWMTARYSVNVPFWDDWLIAVFEGKLSFGSLWIQQNEHRILLPKLIMIALARATDWDFRYLAVANVFEALGVLAVLTLLLTQTVRPLAPSLIPWLILAASLITFSLAQWDSWIWAIAFCHIMSVLAAVATVWALARWGRRWEGLALALLSASAGAFSWGPGLVLLPLVPLGLLLAPGYAYGRRRLLAVAIAVAVSAGVVVFYFTGHIRYAADPLVLPFSRPVLFVHFVLMYLGAGLGSWSAEAAAAWGATGLVTFAGCGVWLWTRSTAYRHAVLPWLLLALYAILSGCLTAVARAFAGPEQALHPHYVTISSVFWVSVIVVVALAIGCFLKNEAVARGRALAVVAVTSSIVTLGAVSYGVTWSRGEAWVRARHETLLRGRECLLAYDRAPNECLPLLGPFHDLGQFRHLAARLETLGRGPFAPSQRERPFSSYTVVVGPGPAGTAGFIDDFAMPQRSGRAVTAGWAMDPFARSTAVAVLVVVDGQVMGRATTGLPRPDVAKASRRNRLRRSGWVFQFGLFRLDPGPHLVEAYAVLDDNRRLVRLAGTRMIDTSE